jgi:hypothetical protein
MLSFDTGVPKEGSVIWTRRPFGRIGLKPRRHAEPAPDGYFAQRNLPLGLHDRSGAGVISPDGSRNTAGGAVPRFLSLLILCAAGLAVSMSCNAQPAEGANSQNELIDWYYAAFFGTGAYRSGDRTVSVLQIPFSREVQPVAADHAGVRLALPISLGFYDFKFDELLGGDSPHRLSTISVLPGIEFEHAVTPSWTLKPYASLGRGWETSGDASAWIYATGIKSRIAMSVGEEVEWSLGNQLTFLGYKPSEAPRQSLGLLVTGLNISLPNRLNLWERSASIDYHLIHYYYFNPMNFATRNNTDNTISTQSEFGVSLKTHKPISLKLFDIDRIGVAYRIGGGVQGIRLLFSLPY